MASIKPYATKAGQRWEVRYVKPDGQGTRKRGFLTKRDATTWQAHALVRIHDGEFTAPAARKSLLGPLIERYVQRTAGFRATTIASRESTAKTWVYPKWSTWQVGKVLKADLQDWVEELAKQNCGAATIEKAHTMMFAVMQTAVDDKLISGNPAIGVKLPPAIKRAHPYLSAAEVTELVSHMDERYRLLVSFLAWTGVRFGEAAALRVGDLNLDGASMVISRSVTEVRGHLIEGPTKSGESRVVPIQPQLVPALRTQIRGLPTNSLVFQAAQGGQLRANTWRNRYLYPGLERATKARAEANRRAYGSAQAGKPFPQITPHDLRHTAASLAVQAQANVLGIQRMLGHESASMTLNVYADLFDTHLVEVGYRMGQLLAGTNLLSFLPTDSSALPA